METKTITTTKTRIQHDSIWKETLEVFFKEFVHFCLPELAKLIDWTKPWTSLDKELHSITKGAKIGTRVVDKLFRVYLKNGKESWVLLHIELQSSRDNQLPERVFIYSYRLYDKYRCPIITCAVLADENKNWHPNRHQVGLAGSYMTIEYLVVKILDYRNRIEELEASNNPFASVILVQLAALEAKKKPDGDRFNIKYALAKRLYKKGYNKNYINGLLKFLDYLIRLPEKLEEKFNNESIKLEEGTLMTYITSFERVGIRKGMAMGIEKGMQKGIQKGKLEGKQEGRQEGRQEGEAALLTRLLIHKFKRVPQKYQQKIHKADIDTLLIWGEKMLDAKSLKEIFD